MSQNPGTGGVAVTYDPPMETVALTLTAADRCDRCGAQAKAKAELEGMELLFCAHHALEQREPLEVKGWRISVVAA